MIEPYTALLTLAAAATSFLAGWHTHRWRAALATRWPRRPTLTPSARRTPRPFRAARR